MDLNETIRYDESQSVEEVFCLIIFTVTIIIVVPLEIWWIVKFCKSTKAVKTISRRHPMVNVIVSSCFVSLNICCMSILILQSRVSNSPLLKSITVATFGIFSTFVSVAAQWVALQCWIIYYQSQLSNLISSKHWKLMINSKLDKHNLNKTQLWILKNHKKWGNWQFLKRLCIVVNIISTAVAIVAFIL